MHRRSAWSIALLGCAIAGFDCGQSFHADPNSGAGVQAGAADAGEAGVIESAAGTAGAIGNGGGGGHAMGGAGGVAGAGGSVVSQGGATGPTIASAAGVYAEGYCERYAACLPVQFSGIYSSHEDCVRAAKLAAVAAFALPNTGRTPSNFTVCGMDRGAQTCAAFRDQKPASCLVAGKLVTGAACSVDAQCASSFCYIQDPFGTCGKCQARNKLDEPCESNGCVPGLTCRYKGDTRVCAPLQAEKASCASNAECPFDLLCVAQVCAKKPALGQTCEAGLGCREAEGLDCLSGTGGSAGLSCFKASFAAPGGACDDAKASFCGGASLCVSNVCTPIAKLGQACDTATRPCEAPYKCLAALCAAPPPDAACH